MSLNCDLLVEIMGAVIALVYIFFEYKASMWLWRIGMLMSLFYIVIFFQSKFYADAAIYVYNFVANIYGVIVWKKQASKQEKSDNAYIGITRMPRKYWLVLMPVVMACWLVLAYVLKNFTDSPVPVGDSFTTALSLVAMWVLAHRYIESWYFWIVVNVVSSALYFSQELYPTTLVFAVYFVMSVLGYFKWKKESGC